MEKSYRRAVHRRSPSHSQAFREYGSYARYFRFIFFLVHLFRHVVVPALLITKNAGSNEPPTF